MAELAARTGLSVATIKYYLREGLLAPGEAVGATRARYDEAHVRRLRLVRALTDIARLKIDTVRSVLSGIDNATTWHEAVASAHFRLSPEPDVPPSAESLERVDAMLTRQGWTLLPDNPLRPALASALDTIESLDVDVPDELLDAYANAMKMTAAVEVANLPMDERERAAEQAVIGTVLLEPVLLAIRRMAQQIESRSRTQTL